MRTRARIGWEVAWLLGVVVVLAGCISQDAASQSPKAKLVQDAEQYISELKAHDKLPGYSSAEDGKLIALASLDSGHVSYPATVIVRGWKEGDNSMYCYTLEKRTKNSAWRLVSATRLDENKK